MMNFKFDQKSFKDSPPAGVMKWFIIELLKGKSFEFYNYEDYVNVPGVIMR